MPPEPSTKRKSYEQFCPMATALDFVGDRWTILILRELLGGPARFQDLKDGLPGIATNLLAERLRRMEADGIVRRVEHGSSSSYALTDDGEAIRTAIEELGLWGGRMAGTVGPVAPPVHERSVRAVAMAMQAILVRVGGLPGEPVVVELDVDGEPIELVLGPRPSARVRPSIDPHARARSTHEDVNALLMGAAGSSAVRHVSGDPEATRLALAVFGL